MVSNAQGDRGELAAMGDECARHAELDDNESYVSDVQRRLQQQLIEDYAAGRRVILIFDEAQNLSRSAGWKSCACSPISTPIRTNSCS